MARLTRAIQKIFGSTATANTIAKFGSLAAGSPAFTTDPTVVQSLANYLTGWFGAVVGGNSPAIEDMNAICFLYARQLAYLFEEGIPEWEAGTTYYTGSIVTSGAGVAYVSLANNNTGNAVTDTTKWRIFNRATTGSQASPAAVGGATPVAVSAGGGDQDVYIKSTTAPWTSRTLAEANAMTAVCWSSKLGLFAACSSAGSSRIQTSVDGINWVAQGGAAAQNTQAICYADRLGLFVAIGIDGVNRTQVSPDGITWTEHASTANNTWTSVCYSHELNTLVAISLDGTNRVMYSIDGVNWTSASAAEANAWQSVCWAKELGLFVAVATGGTHRVMTSPDGITWTARTAAAANSWYSVCYSSELALLVAVSIDGTSRVMTSPDGITWTARTAATANAWQCVVYAPGFGAFFATATTGTNRVMYSIDGTTWTAQAESETNAWPGICYSPDLNMLVAVAAAGTHRAMTFTAVSITANPQIAAGSYQGQRLTLIGSDGVNQPQIVNGNGVAVKATQRFRRSYARTFLWDAGQSIWIED